ncbi:MAG: hydroxyacid dehydrogenase [Propionibacteriaceae bacterium]|jgi:phosphoglycerate dehydrogenase-like enzyme|nr:hydroxyacid dehydrogenase [Propionibacteriaceae bacterium]
MDAATSAWSTPADDRPPDHVNQVAVALTDELRQSFFTVGQWERLESLAEVRSLPTPLDFNTSAARAVLASAEVLLTGWSCPPLSEDVLDSCPHLRAIIHTGGSVRAFVGPEVFRRGIQVSSQTDLNAEPVAQFCLAQILLAAKGVARATRRYAATKSLDTFHLSDDAVDETPDRDSAARLAEDGPASTRLDQSTIGAWKATVGLIGYGRVCHHLIGLLRAFPVRILLNSPYVNPAQAEDLGVELTTPEQIMSDADVISIHLGDTPDNHAAINADLLSLIKPGATFINTARGIVVDEPALIHELTTGRFDAILDVTWPETPAPDSRLWTLPNVTLTPHWAGSLGRELTRLGQGVIDNLEQYLAGQPMTGQVPPELAAYIA